MGIRPNGSGAIPPVTPDNPETRYSDWLADLEDSGEIVGGVWQETDAKASAGNDGVTDLAGRVAAMETLHTASGAGWSAYKRGGIVTLIFSGLTGHFQLPPAFYPPITIFAPFAMDSSETTARARIRDDGLVTRQGAGTTAYGFVTYVSTSI